MGYKYKFTDKQLIDASVGAKSAMEVFRRLNIKSGGGTIAHFSRRLKNLNLSFLGQGHSKGTISTKRRSADSILVLRTNGIRTGRNYLERSLLEKGRDYICVKCGNTGLWNNEKLVLEIDHINKNWLDDRLENLQFLCPNCHQQKDK